MNCRYVDFWSKISDPQDFSPYLIDGLHFNEAGNAFLFKLLEPQINELISSLPVPMPDWKDLAGIEY